MLSGPVVLFLGLPTLLAPLAANAAVVSLFIPDVARTSGITAEFLGTDTAGHTTWAIGVEPSELATDTITPASLSLAMPAATMVAGPTDLHLVYDLPHALGRVYHEDCGIQSGVALCTIVLSGSANVSTVGVRTKTVSPFAVQVGATATSAAPSTSATGTDASTAGATGTATTASGTASATGGGNQAGDGHGNGAVAGATAAGLAVAFGAVGIAFAMLS